MRIVDGRGWETREKAPEGRRGAASAGTMFLRERPVIVFGWKPSLGDLSQRTPTQLFSCTINFPNMERSALLAPT